MLRRTVFLILAFAILCSAKAYGEVNATEAFSAHRKLMTGGVWVSKDKDGNVLVDRHTASKSKKFVRIQSIVGDEYFAGIYGIDPKTGKLTLWSFREDGAVGTWVCTRYENGRWTFKGEAGGKSMGVAEATRVSKDELRLVIEAEDERTEQVWKRR